jgi:hypothetical protein
VDYDRDADLSKYRTFAWANTPETSLEKVNPFMHSKIVNSIEYYLTEGGLTENTDDPDLFVTYHTNGKEEVRVDTSHFGYGYGGGYYASPYWGGGYYGSVGIGTSTSTVRKYVRGTLLIDIWDARKNTLVWRGGAEDVVKSDPVKVAKQIDRALAKIVKKWDSMKKKRR